MLFAPPEYSRNPDESGTIEKTYGTISIDALRKMHGPNFALGFAGTVKLSQVLHMLDEPSLWMLRLGQPGAAGHSAPALDQRAQAS